MKRHAVSAWTLKQSQEFQNHWHLYLEIRMLRIRQKVNLFTISTSLVFKSFPTEALLRYFTSAHLSEISGGLSSSSATVGIVRPACTSILQRRRGENTVMVGKHTESVANMYRQDRAWKGLISLTSKSLIALKVFILPLLDSECRKHT